MSRFTNKTAIVTGAAGALGTSMVRRFAAEGANVVIGARREEQVTHLVDELGSDRVVFAKLDVSDEQQWTEAVQTAASYRRRPRLDPGQQRRPRHRRDH